MHITKAQVAVTVAGAFWFYLIYLLSGGRFLRPFLIAGATLVLLGLPVQAFANCSQTITPDGKYCKVCCNPNGVCQTFCI